MEEEFEIKSGELRSEFEISIKELKIRQEVDNRDIERNVEEFKAHISR